MVVGDEDVDTLLITIGDACVSGYAVVDGDDEVRFGGCVGIWRVAGDVRDVGGEAVAVLDAIGDEVSDLCSGFEECGHGHACGGGSIGVIVGEDEDVFLRADVVPKDGCGLVGACEF